MASALFLDIEGAFPNAVTDRLLHNMRTRWVPEEYVRFVGRLLEDQKTRLKFDDYISEPVPIDNGIGQGDPISMILYLFYNADLLDVPTGKELAIAFVDDVSFCAEGATFEDTHRTLHDMMTQLGD